MNSSLRGFISIDIKCTVTRYSAEDKVISKEEDVVTFYNHSESIDSNITPFDLSVVNPHIDIKNNIPLKIHVVCDREKRYELCIKSEHGRRECTFEIVTKIGGLNIEIPSEVIWSDLELSTLHKLRHFDIYWVKFEGVRHRKLMNRKYIRVDNSKITFNDKNMMPMASERIGPTGKELSNDFVLSHRYFVYTLRKWSELGNMMEFGNNRLNKTTFLWHEAQGVENISRIFSAESSDNDKEIKQALLHDTRSRQIIIKGTTNSNKKQIMKDYVSTYAKQPEAKVKIYSQPIPKKRSGGCGCSRKRNG